MDVGINDVVDIKHALPLLALQLGEPVKHGTASAWVRRGFLPGLTLAGQPVVPKAAIRLFSKPDAGRYARRKNLARGIGIALVVLGRREVETADAVVNAKCPRCGSPWVIRGGLPGVIGHEADLCCCALDCLYIGADFIRAVDPRVVQRENDVLFLLTA